MQPMADGLWAATVLPWLAGAGFNAWQGN